MLEALNKMLLLTHTVLSLPFIFYFANAEGIIY